MSWFSVNDRTMSETGEVAVPVDGDTSFTLPFTEAGPAVLYLKRVER